MKNAPDYRVKREKNNVAVKKSREKSKRKTNELVSKLDELKKENSRLEDSIHTLNKELDFFTNLFREHANKIHGIKLSDEELRRILENDNEDSLEMISLLTKSNTSISEHSFY